MGFRLVGGLVGRWGGWARLGCGGVGGFWVGR